MIHPRCAGTPHRGRRARPRNDQTGPRPRLHGHVDAIGVRSPPETRHVDLTMKVRLARRPRPAPEPVAAERMPWPDVTPVRADPARVRVARLGSLPTPWLGGRPSPTWGHARSGRD